MILKKFLSVLLSFTLLSACIPLNAQPLPKRMPEQNYRNNGIYNNTYWQNPFTAPSFNNNFPLLIESQPVDTFNLDMRIHRTPRAFIYEGLSTAEAVYIWKKLNNIAPNTQMSQENWREYYKETNINNRSYEQYKTVISNISYSPYKNYSPSQAINEIEKLSKEINSYLKKNPKYIKELKKLEAQQNTLSLLDGLLIGLALVAAVYTCGAAGCGIGAAWFGGSPAAATTTTITTGTIIKTFAIVAMIEIATDIALEEFNNLYEDLTNRLIKLKKIENNKYVELLLQVAHKGTVLSQQALSEKHKISLEPKEIAPRDNTYVHTPYIRNPQIEFKRNIPQQWDDIVVKNQAIIKIHALIVIRNYLRYSTDSYKYDLAMLDIINLFSDVKEVEFDEKVEFTRKKYVEGEVKYENTSNTLHFSNRREGRLLERTPELIKALKQVQNM